MIGSKVPLIEDARIHNLLHIMKSKEKLEWHKNLHKIKLQYVSLLCVPLFIMLKMAKLYTNSLIK